MIAYVVFAAIVGLTGAKHYESLHLIRACTADIIHHCGDTICEGDLEFEPVIASAGEMIEACVEDPKWLEPWALDDEQAKADTQRILDSVDRYHERYRTRLEEVVGEEYQKSFPGPVTPGAAAYDEACEEMRRFDVLTTRAARACDRLLFSTYVDEWEEWE